MAQDKNNLLLLFQKPLEPVFTKKDGGKSAFDLPADFYTDRYKTVGPELQTRFGEEVENKVHNVFFLEISFHINLKIFSILYL